jgi:hypothetical protein
MVVATKDKEGNSRFPFADAQFIKAKKGKVESPLLGHSLQRNSAGGGDEK